LIPALVIAVLVLAALAYVAVPLRRGAAAPRQTNSPPSSEAEAKKRAALEAILDLESEHDVGKLSDSDLEALRRDYEAHAVAALQELDAEGDADADDELEAEIAAMKERLRCPSCGKPRPSGALCRTCGR
jgi:cytochrome c-type biogenesis protein CcmH/NrfF